MSTWTLKSRMMMVRAQPHKTPLPLKYLQETNLSTAQINGDDAEKKTEKTDDNGTSNHVYPPLHFT